MGKNLKQSWYLPSGIVIALIIIIGGLVWWQKRGTENVIDKTKEPIKIGAIYQETGSGADWGKKAENGLNIAVETINEKGGISGHRVEVVYEDSKSNPADAVTAMNKLITVDGVKAVLSQQSSVVVALSPIANNNKIILIDTGSTTPAYISPDDFTFRTSYSATYFAKDISSLLNDKQAKPMGLLYVNNDYGQGMLGAYKEYFKGKIVVAENFSQEDTDFKTQLQKIKSANPEVIIYASDPKQAGIILKQKTELGLSQTFYTDTYAIEYQSTLDVAGKTAEGVIFSSQYYNTERNDKIFKEFDNKYKKKYNEASNALSAQTSDGLSVLTSAIGQCKNILDTECIKNKLLGMKDFAGVIGSITFDKYGEILERPTILKTVKDGKFVPYEK